MKKPILASVALFAALALSACGTSEPSGGATASRSAGIELEDASGTKVMLDAPATKVVGTEWNVVENPCLARRQPSGRSGCPRLQCLGSGRAAEKRAQGHRYPR